MSTGRKSACLSLLQYIVRMTPFPAPIRSPIGPFILSVHPGNGSFHIGTTETKSRISVCLKWSLDLHRL
jgi:hypothetical protein